MLVHYITLPYITLTIILTLFLTLALILTLTHQAKTLNFSIAYGKTVHGLAMDWGRTP